MPALNSIFAWNWSWWRLLSDPSVVPFLLKMGVNFWNNKSAQLLKLNHQQQDDNHHQALSSLHCPPSTPPTPAESPPAGDSNILVSSDFFTFIHQCCSCHIIDNDANNNMSPFLLKLSAEAEALPPPRKSAKRKPKVKKVMTGLKNCPSKWLDYDF